MTEHQPDAPTEPERAIVAHVINHTHWDREWFLTHEYTTAWIPELIDSLGELAAQNHQYEYLFDGQTLVIEDLLEGRPDYRAAVEELITKRTLHIGPVYSQPDWRMLSGQLHVRNLLFGTDDAAELGGEANVAWLVDTFGHISQAPQLLSMVGIDAAYVWRGVPEMLPVFLWQGANGRQIPTINLFGGYRNLYGITKTPEIAVDRLVAETTKLAPYYGSVPIPLFDGYDLDTQPEDPARYYEQVGVPDTVTLKASSPRTYVDAVAGDLDREHPVIEGELISGRYGSTFPGTLSARTHLKVLHHDAEAALQLRAEPLAVMANSRGREYPAALYEAASRELLKNGVHDCICGVSVDQVHERMDRSYRDLIDTMAQETQASIDTIFCGFATGTYALSTSAMATTSVQRIDRSAVVSTTTGIGVEAVQSVHPVKKVEEPAQGFSWSNQHYSATVDGDGLLVDGHRLARLVVRADDGDTYSSESGAVIGTCQPTGPPMIESRSDVDTVIRFDTALEVEDLSVRAVVRARFDATPIVGLTIDLDSDGTGFRADLQFETGISSDRIAAAMPFDLVHRPHQDFNLLPDDVGPELSGVLMGQREVRMVDEFPFQGFVAVEEPGRTCAVLARGIRSYSSDATGMISVALRRSVEWLARSGLAHRQGDAGPAMYVPGARSERTIRHEVGFAVLCGPSRSELDLWRLNEGFQNPPLLVQVRGSGRIESWSVFDEDLPTAGFELLGDRPVLRMFNPQGRSHQLSTERSKVSVRGADLGTTSSVAAKEIVNVTVDIAAPRTEPTRSRLTHVNAHGLPEVRVGHSRSRPDASILDQLARRRAELRAEMSSVTDQIERATGTDRYRLTHREVVLAREEAEIGLSLELNRRRAASDDLVSIPDEVDPVIAKLGSDLNDLRVKRRIFDYVVQSLAT